jgi:hypothetical protein
MAHAVLLSHPTDDPGRRRQRLGQLRDLAAQKAETASQAEQAHIELLVHEYGLASAMDMGPARRPRRRAARRPSDGRRDAPGEGGRVRGASRVAVRRPGEAPRASAPRAQAAQAPGRPGCRGGRPRRAQGGAGGRQRRRTPRRDAERGRVLAAGAGLPPRARPPTTSAPPATPARAPSAPAPSESSAAADAARRAGHRARHGRAGQPRPRPSTSRRRARSVPSTTAETSRPRARRLRPHRPTPDSPDRGNTAAGCAVG